MWNEHKIGEPRSHICNICGKTIKGVNFSHMSPKLVQTQPHKIENWRITMAPFFF